jgi:uncharacterized protein YggT (Ycf19 family)
MPASRSGKGGTFMDVIMILKITAAFILTIIVIIIIMRLWNRLIEASGIPGFIRKIFNSLLAFFRNYSQRSSEK